MTQRGTPTFSLSDALDLFLLDCAARRLTEGTMQFYTSKLSVFIRWCHEEDVDALEDVSAHDIRRFLVHIPYGLKSPSCLEYEAAQPCDSSRG